MSETSFLSSFFPFCFLFIFLPDVMGFSFGVCSVSANIWRNFMPQKCIAQREKGRMSGMKWNGGVRVGRTETLCSPPDVTIEDNTLIVYQIHCIETAFQYNIGSSSFQLLLRFLTFSWNVGGSICTSMRVRALNGEWRRTSAVTEGDGQAHSHSCVGRSRSDL